MPEKTDSIDTMLEDLYLEYKDLVSYPEKYRNLIDIMKKSYDIYSLPDEEFYSIIKQFLEYLEDPECHKLGEEVIHITTGCRIVYGILKHENETRHLHGKEEAVQ